MPGVLKASLKTVGVVLLLLALALLVWPPGWPERPKAPSTATEGSLDLVARASTASLNSLGTAFLDGSPMEVATFGESGHLNLLRLNVPDTVGTDLPALRLQGEVVIKSPLAFTMHIDEMVVRVYVVADRKDSGKLQATVIPVVTNLRIREFGDAFWSTRLNQLTAYVLSYRLRKTGGASKSDTKDIGQSEEDDVTLKIELKDAARTIKFEVQEVEATMSDDALELRAGPLLQKK